MSDKLKAFVNKHKQEFDSAKPSKDLWKKIDAKMEVKNSSAISSKWLSKLKYFGLSATILVIGVYFVSKNITNTSSNELALHRKDSAINNSEEWAHANQNKSGINVTGNSIEANNTNAVLVTAGNKPESNLNATSDNPEKNTNSIADSLNDISVKSHEAGAAKLENPATAAVVKEETKPNSVKEKKTETIIEEPAIIDTYNCVIWTGPSFCSAIRSYKFSGQVNMEGMIVTTGCNELSTKDNLKAVWLKGKISKKLTLSLKDDFKNIILIKANGKKYNPEAISHYYTGSGVISKYKGKRFSMVFKDKVELILFFKDVEAGDKIMIDEVIETTVTN